LRGIDRERTVRPQQALRHPQRAGRRRARRDHRARGRGDHEVALDHGDQRGRTRGRIDPRKAAVGDAPLEDRHQPRRQRGERALVRDLDPPLAQRLAADQHPARERRGIGVRAVSEVDLDKRRELRGGRIGGRERGVEDREMAIRQHADGLDQDLELAAEVVVDEAGGQPRLLGDRDDRGALVAALRHHRQQRLGDLSSTLFGVRRAGHGP
jgi:hypothetical protein